MVYQQGEMWPAQEMKYHINSLELLALKLAILTFTKYREVKVVHLQVDNTVALTYVMKIGRKGVGVLKI